MKEKKKRKRSWSSSTTSSSSSSSSSDSDSSSSDSDDGKSRRKKSRKKRHASTSSDSSDSSRERSKKKKKSKKSSKKRSKKSSSQWNRQRHFWAGKIWNVFFFELRKFLATNCNDRQRRKRKNEMNGNVDDLFPAVSDLRRFFFFRCPDFFCPFRVSSRWPCVCTF